jgi:hypothetical protein
MLDRDTDSTDAEDRPECVTCRARAPKTTTDHTVISRFGWRLGRRAVAGRYVMEWRCPACFKRFKETQSGQVPITNRAPKAGRVA